MKNKIIYDDLEKIYESECDEQFGDLNILIFENNSKYDEIDYSNKNIESGIEYPDEINRNYLITKHRSK